MHTPALKMGRALGKRSGETRRENRPWVPHAEELARAARGDDPTLSNEKIADHVVSSWKLAAVEFPGHRTLTRFVSELRTDGRLQQRTRSLPKRTRSRRKRTR